LTSARIPCKEIKRYPVVARWRNDVEFTAAGIYCFQPYCVTGEMDAPANPLICPQFCVRFNDLDNIGVTGRHYSGFIMIGIQVFNLPDKYIFFKDECTEFNYRWLTETLKIEPEEITFTEDVWAGGGNLGPSIEYFVGGLEVGNMVFMQYKTAHDGTLSDLPVKVIDVGIGLERIAWLVNGTPSSYVDTFAEAYDYLRVTLGVPEHTEVWEKFGPYSCQLNVDDAEDINKTWEEIAAKINLPVEKVKESIGLMRDIYIVLDHTRTVMMIIEDGALPSNVGGGGNVRNVLRRVFAILHKNGWWDKLKMEGLMKLFEMHRLKLGKLYGPFPENKSFPKVIQVEYDRWLTTDEAQTANLNKLLKKSKGVLTLDDWIVAVTSWGIPADKVAVLTKLPIPPNLYYEIARRQETTAKAAEEILYDTTHLPETENLYYKDHRMTEFKARVVDIIENKQDKMIPNILVLDQSAFYPFSGGQAHDLGTILLDGIEYTLTDCQRIGKAVLHILDKPLPKEKKAYIVRKGTKIA
jgi:alanyl-tRNA synthetase